MSKFSNDLETKLFNATLRNTAYSSPATVYVGLNTADPTDAGNGAEVTGGSYARQSIAFAAPTNGAGSNSAEITFPQASANWGTITHFSIWDAVSSGNLMYHGALSASVTINNGEQFKFNAGSVTITLD